jgi:hypothetical protein
MLTLPRKLLQYTLAQTATVLRATTCLAVVIPAQWSLHLLVTMDKTSKPPWHVTPDTMPTIHAQATPSQRPPQLLPTHPYTPRRLPDAPHPATASPTKKSPATRNPTRTTTSHTTANQLQSNTSLSPKPEYPTATSNTLLRPRDPFTLTSTAVLSS